VENLVENFSNAGLKSDLEGAFTTPSTALLKEELEKQRKRHPYHFVTFFIRCGRWRLLMRQDG
jgi:hypothetical protein